MGDEPHPGFSRRRREERRHHPRTEHSLSATMEHPDGRLAGQLESLSAGGASFITTTETPELVVGTRVTLTWDGSRATGHAASIVRCDEFFDGESDVLEYSVRFSEPIDVGAAGG